MNVGSIVAATPNVSGRSTIAATIRFSWAGLILAPLLAPLLFTAALLGSPEDSRWLLAFLVFMVPGCIVAYGATIFLFLPSLYLLSARWKPTGFRVCLLGLVLGAVVAVPLMWMAWKSSGPDSGPPVEGFLSFALGWAVDPMMAIFPAAGLVTAGLYWWLGTRRHRHI
jgi:hypothetical protein